MMMMLTVISTIFNTSSSSSFSPSASDVDDVFGGDEQFGRHGDEAFGFPARDVGLRRGSGGSQRMSRRRHAGCRGAWAHHWLGDRGDGIWVTGEGGGGRGKMGKILEQPPREQEEQKEECVKEKDKKKKKKRKKKEKKKEKKER